MFSTNVMNFLKGMSGTWLAFLTFFITATGLLIINLHLGKHFITDYNIINTRAIHAGIVFFFVIGSSITVIFAFLEIRDVAGIDARSAITNFATKPIHLTNLFIMTFVFTGNSPEESQQIIVMGGYTLNVYWLFPLLMGSTFGFMMKISGYEYVKNTGDLLGKFTGKGSDFFLKIGLIPFPILFYYYETYSDVFWFFAAISFFCMVIFGTIQDRARRHSNDLPNIDPSIFTKDTNVQSMSFLDSIFLICVIVVMLISFSASYSKTIYPKLDLQYGGGKAIEMIIGMEDGSNFIGKLFHYDDKRYYLTTEIDSKTVFVDAAKIRFIEKYSPHKKR